MSEEDCIGSAEAEKKKLGPCLVCEEDADGFFFGANVCLPCKSFFVRTLSEDLNSMKCSKNTNDCVVIRGTRSSCKMCRFQKCLKVGMNRKVRPEVVEAGVNQELCAVCQDIANGVHFGALTCEGCKKFFRRSLKESGRYICKLDENCVINPRTRNSCRYCRYQKCLRQGMSKDVRIGRPRKEVTTILSSDVKDEVDITEVAQHSASTGLPQNDSQRLDHMDKASLLDIVNTPMSSSSYACQIDERNTVWPRGVNLKRKDDCLHAAATTTDQEIDKNISHNATTMSAYKNETNTFNAVCQLAGDSVGEESPIFNSLHQSDLPDMSSYETSGKNFSSGNALKHKLESCLETGSICSCNKLRKIAVEKMDVPQNVKAVLMKRIECGDLNQKEPQPADFPSNMMSVMSKMMEMKQSTMSQSVDQSPNTNAMNRGHEKQFPHTMSSVPDMKKDKPDIMPAVMNMKKDMPDMMSAMMGMKKDMPDMMSAMMGMKRGMPDMMSAMMGMKNDPQTSKADMNIDESSTVHERKVLSHLKGDMSCDSETFVVDGVKKKRPANFDSSDRNPPMKIDGNDLEGSHVLNTVLEKFNKIKCPSCQNPSGSNSPMQEDAKFYGKTPVCFVHCSPDLPHKAELEYIPPCPANCICMKEIPSSDINTAEKDVFCVEDIKVRPSTQAGNTPSQFTVMLENMMDKKKLTEEKHKVIHPTPQNCIDTVDRLRKLLQFFGIQELEPKSNAKFSSHVFPKDYWLSPKLPDENILLDFKNKSLLETVVSAYNNFIAIMHEKVFSSRPPLDKAFQWPMDIVRKRTIRNLSHWITFVKTIPNFVNINPGDQFNIVRLAGMMGIMLATALHQYDPTKHNFTNFYNFEFHPEHPHYHFRHAFLDFGRDIQELQCDFVESAMLSACMAVAVDFPDLEEPEIIDEIRCNLLEAFRAYTTAKYGSPNGRVEKIFSWIPRLRELGLWNYQLSFSTCFSFEETASGTQSEISP